MPYSLAQQASWTSDEALFANLEGASEMISWFGFIPSFHDSTIQSMCFDSSGGRLVLSAFRMTSEIDERGFFILDRHARVIFHFDGVTGILLGCNPFTTVSEVGLRRLTSAHLPVLNTAASAGDYEIGFDDVCGGSGAIYAKAVSISFRPEAY